MEDLLGALGVAVVIISVGLAFGIAVFLAEYCSRDRGI